MIATTRFMVVAAAVILLTACASQPALQVGAPQSDATEFDQALARDYEALSQAERMQGDSRDAGVFGLRAAAAAMGQPPPPDDITTRGYVGDSHMAELSAARERLAGALDNAARDKIPGPAARAQSSFDCWVEQADEDLQPAHIEACKASFLAAIDEVEGALAQAPEVATAPAPPPPAEPPAPAAPDNYLVFFDFDKAELTPAAQDILDNVEAAATESPVTRIIAVGHADTSGSASYNMGLSQRRAEAVRSALMSRDVQAGSIVTDARGEEEPLVPTGDGVREPQNRRVEITLER